MAGIWGVDARFTLRDSGGSRSDLGMISISHAGLAHRTNARLAHS
jgi:hypothetical protein